MRLFISYARVDKPYCAQIVEVLDVHDVWYDQRLHAGQQWWDEILKRIDWCDGLVYLLSPDSVASEYCRKELDLARKAGKHVFPVMIHSRVEIPESLRHIQYADLTRGLTPEAVKMLLNSIYITEREGARVRKPMPALVVNTAEPPGVNPNTMIDDVADAFDTSHYDRAVFLLKQAQESGYKSRFINIEAVLREAEAALERQSYLREAEREYQPIAALVKRTRTRKLGCRAFQAFRQQFPDYDPDNLASICAAMMLPLLEWVTIPAGETTIAYDQKDVTYHVKGYSIGKYPVTNAQFQAFIDDPEGYANPQWWGFSAPARAWREQNTKPLPPKFAWGDHPRANICWYEAMAFCHWLTDRTGLNLTLPTEAQWQRAAQGDDGRIYPWGNKFDKSRCNTRESKLRMTCPVTRFENGASPYGVYGMAGNVWQWCCNGDYQATDSEGDTARAVRGGAFISVAQRARATFHFYLNPLYRYATIGFRVVINTD